MKCHLTFPSILQATLVLLVSVVIQGLASANTVVIESSGNTDLLLGDTGYYIGSESRPFTSGGVQVNENSLAGWTLLGAEANAFDGYYVVWQSGTTFALWALDANGAYIGGLLQSAADLIPYETDFNQDLNGDGHIGEPPPTVIESAGSVSLEESTGGYSVNSGTAVPVTYLGTRVSSTTAPPWVMIGTETDGGTGYRVIWQHGTTFAMWVLDANGAFVSGVAINGILIKQYESEFGQDFDGDGNVGFDTPTVVESDGDTSLLTSDDTIFIGNQTRPLVYLGNPVSTSALGAWQPLGVEAIANGYEYFWYDGVTFALWILDADGNYVTGRIVSASDIRAFEDRFVQDLNGDAVIGYPPAQTLESAGTTSLLLGDSGFFIDTEARPLLFNSSQVATLGVWQPVGVEALQGSGYEMVWQYGASIAVWTLDTNGNYLSGVLVSGKSIRDYEARFAQDIDGDGSVGPPPTTTIESAGATSLIHSADGYAIDSTSRPVLLNGVQVDEFTMAGWTPAGVEATFSGYNLIWQQGNTFVLWVLDADGNYLSGAALGLLDVRTYEQWFFQDLNGDGHQGIPPAAVIEEQGNSKLLLGDTGYFIGSEQTPLLLNGVQVTPATLAGWTALGVEYDSTFNEYQLILTDGSKYIAWYVTTSGGYYDNYLISRNEVMHFEQGYGQDLNGNGVIDSPSVGYYMTYTGTFAGQIHAGRFISIVDSFSGYVEVYSIETNLNQYDYDLTGIMDLQSGVVGYQFGQYATVATYTNVLMSGAGNGIVNGVNHTIAVSGNRSVEGVFEYYAGVYYAYGEYWNGSYYEYYDYTVIVTYGGEIWLAAFHDSFGVLIDEVAVGTMNGNGSFVLSRADQVGTYTGRITLRDNQLEVAIDNWNGRVSNRPIPKIADI